MATRSKAITSGEYAVRIDGLKAFAKALKVVDEKYPGALRDANYDLASQVVDHAQRRARGEPGVALKASKSLRASKQAAQATVAGGGARYPYFYGAEFGSKSYRQFQNWRGNQWNGWAGGPGYFLHPTIRDDAPELISAYMDHLDKLAAQAFPDE